MGANWISQGSPHPNLPPRAEEGAYERLDVTSFIMRNVLPTAREVVDRAERIVLSERDTKRVLKLLETPPTAALPASARRRLART